MSASLTRSQHCTPSAVDGDIFRTVHADGLSESISYDANGNTLSQTDRGGRTTKMVYDKVNRLIETILPDQTPATDTDNPRTRSVYNAGGHLIQSIDENANVTAYEYDAAGRQIKTILPTVNGVAAELVTCLLYTSDAADE